MTNSYLMIIFIIPFFERNDYTLYCIILDQKIVDSRPIVAVAIS